LTLKGISGEESLSYAYQCRQAQMDQLEFVGAVVPQVATRLTMHAGADEVSGYYREGFAFSPMFSLGIQKTLVGKGELHTWLKVEKAS
jgi:hypothetical protein